MQLQESFIWPYLSRLWSFYKDKVQHEALWQIIIYISYGYYIRLAQILNGRSIVNAPEGLANTFLNSKGVDVGTFSGRTIDGSNILSVSDFWSGTPNLPPGLKVVLSTLEDDSFQELPGLLWSIDKFEISSYVSLVDAGTALSSLSAFNFTNKKRRGNVLFGDGFAEFSYDGDVVVDRSAISDPVVEILRDHMDYLAVSYASGSLEVYNSSGVLSGAERYFTFPIFDITVFNGYIYFVMSGKVYRREGFNLNALANYALFEMPGQTVVGVLGIMRRNDLIYVFRPSGSDRLSYYNVITNSGKIEVSVLPPEDLPLAEIIDFKYNPSNGLLAIVWQYLTTKRVAIYYFSPDGRVNRISRFGILSGTYDEEGELSADEVLDFEFFQDQNRIICLFAGRDDKRYFNVFNITSDQVLPSGLIIESERDIDADGFFLFEDSKICTFKEDTANVALTEYVVDPIYLDFSGSLDFRHLGEIPSENFVELNTNLLESIVLLNSPNLGEDNEQNQPKDIISNWSWQLIKENDYYVFKITNFGYTSSNLYFLPEAQRGGLEGKDKFFNSGVFSFGEQGDIIRLFQEGNENVFDEGHLNFFVTMFDFYTNSRGAISESSIKVKLQRNKMAQHWVDLIESETGLTGTGLKFYNSPTQYKIQFNDTYDFPLPVKKPLIGDANNSTNESNSFLFSQINDTFFIIKRESGDFIFEYPLGVDYFILSNDGDRKGVYKIVKQGITYCLVENCPYYAIDELTNLTINVGTFTAEFSGGVLKVTTSGQQPMDLIGAYFVFSAVKYYIGDCSSYNLKTGVFDYNIYQDDFSLTVEPTGVTEVSLFYRSSWYNFENFSLAREVAEGDKVFSDVYCVSKAGVLNREPGKEARTDLLENIVYEEI